MIGAPNRKLAQENTQHCKMKTNGIMRKCMYLAVIELITIQRDYL